MKKSIFSLAAICIIMSVIQLIVYAHPGKTDSNGGHYNRKTGEYHYHNGGTSSSGSSSNSSSSSSGSSSSSYSSAPKTVYASKVDVPNMPSKINVGESVQLQGTAYPSDAVDQTISYESSDESIAAVDANGNLTAVSAGTAIISAKTTMGTTSQYTVTVNEIIAQSIEISSKPKSIMIGDKIALNVIFAPDNTTNKDIQWASSNTDVAEISQRGELIGKALGKSQITAVHNDLSDLFEIEVLPVRAESIKILLPESSDTKEKNTENQVLDSQSFRLEKGTALQLNAVILPENTTDKTVKWTVNDEAVASIDENGLLSAVDNGRVTVSAETENGIKTDIEIEVYSQTTHSAVGLSVITASVIAAAIYFSKRKKHNKI